jgi:acyl CoA:acetate/3-ketoacid CoA transferase beta subunit
LAEIAPDTTVEEVVAKTEATLIIPEGGPKTIEY